MITSNTDLKLETMNRLSKAITELNAASVEAKMSLATAFDIDLAAPCISDIKAWANYYKDVENNASIAITNASEKVEGLLKTSNLNLMFCPKNYVVTTKGTKLLSPSGYHPTDRVYIQTEIAIHTDSINDAFPDCGKPLVSFNVSKAANESVRPV